MSNPRTITVILTGQAGELARDSFTITPDHTDPDEAISNAAGDIIEGWVLSVGDTIQIAEG